MCRARQHLIDRAKLDEASRIHHRNPITAQKQNVPFVLSRQKVVFRRRSHVLAYRRWAP
jgi:hypothetical protein